MTELKSADPPASPSPSKTRARGSLVRSLLSLTDAERAEALAAISPEEAALIDYDWTEWARDEQLPPDGDWRIWLLLGGRGGGKTRPAVEWIRGLVEAGEVRRIALLAATAADGRDVIVEGESGFLACCPPWNYPHYEPSKRRLTWPNGARATLFSAEEPDRLRGPQHDVALVDELAVMDQRVWDNLLLGLRLGMNPRCVVATTPRPTKLIKALIADPTVVVSPFDTYANRDNLAPAFFREIITRYEGTRLGRQEIHAEILEDVQGALWTLDRIDAHRRAEGPAMQRMVVAIDPAVTAHEGSDETGIIVAGKARCSCRGEPEDHGFVLADRSGRMHPQEWSAAAVAALKEFKADRIVAEVNNGGDLVEAVLRTVDRNVPYRAVHASRGKVTRAEPIAALYEQGKVHHVGLGLAKLEDQMTTWVPGEKSPDRMDALVWALTDLMLSGAGWAWA